MTSMADPVFLSEADLLLIHQNQIDLYGGLHGVRDQGLLESAIAQPQATFGGRYLHEDIFEMAAAYTFHIVSDHPFHDGNKRVGAMAAFAFLDANNFDLQAPENEFEKLVLQTASGGVHKGDLAEFFKKYSILMSS